MRSFWVSSALVALLGFAAAAPCSAVTCGETITDAQTLTADLTCSTSPGLTIGAGGSLDMDGFKLTCNGTSYGIWLGADGAKLSNGVVTGCSAEGVHGDANGHKIHHVFVSSSNSGFRLYGSGNKVTDCAATGSVFFGFYASAGGSSLARITVLTTNGTGFFAGGGGNKISDISISGSGSYPGLQVTGDENKISKVRVTGASNGVSISGNFNKVSDTTSLNHVVYGLEIQGDSNQVKKSVASAGPGAISGFEITSGVGNKITGCRSMGSNIGINIGGSGQVVSKNTVLGSNMVGIFARGASAIIEKNIVAGSATTDLFEFNPGCSTGNVWSDNVGKSNDGCID